MRNAYWSLLCFPLMFIFLIAAIFLDRTGHSGPAAGCAILGLYMFFFQVLWAHIADKSPFGIADVILAGGYLCGSVLAVALLFCRSIEPLSLKLVLAACAAPLLGQMLSSTFGRIFEGRGGGGGRHD